MDKSTGKKVLFIDRDGTLIKEAPPSYQIDAFDKLVFYPGVLTWLGRIARELDFELVLVTNQDGLGSASFPEDSFWPIQNFIMETFQNEGIVFSAVYIDPSYPADKTPNRKPGTGMLKSYLQDPGYNLPGSFVIGDRVTDVQLAKNLGCQAIWLNEDETLGNSEITDEISVLQSSIFLETRQWSKIYEVLKLGKRKWRHRRATRETQVDVTIDLDGNGAYAIDTGLKFLDHLLEQLSKHSGIDLSMKVQGDLHVDEHHTIEDTAIALGESMAQALADKMGIRRYGYVLPMDDCLAQVAVDLGGRSWLVWDAAFQREKIGDVPTEMFFHFFKSFSDAARCNLHIQAQGTNEHHKIEAIFKALAYALKMAIKRDPDNSQLPTTKGVL